MHIYTHGRMGVCRMFSIQTEVADVYFKDLQAEAFAHAHELLGEVTEAAQRLWTSAKIMK